MSAIDKLRRIAEERDLDVFLVRDGITYRDAREIVAEVDRLTAALQFEQHWLSRIGTHGPGCWKWGPGHWLCAINEIKRLDAVIARLRAENERWKQVAEDAAVAPTRAEACAIVETALAEGGK